MKTKLSIFTTVLAALSLLPLPAKAQIPIPTNQWVYTSQTQQGDMFYIDKGSIKFNQGIYGFWLQAIHPNGNVAASRVFMAANCGSDVMQQVWVIEADINGQIITNARANTEAFQAMPGTVNYQMLDAVCTGFSSDSFSANLTRRHQHNSEAIQRAMEFGAKLFR